MEQVPKPEVHDPEALPVHQRTMLEEQLRSRITVVEQVHFQSHLQQPVTSEETYHFPLDSEEEPFSIRMKPGTTWVQLEHGWLEKASLLRIVNETGRRPHDPRLPKPTEEELAGHVVEVGVLVKGVPFEVIQSCFFVSPRRDVRVEPIDDLDRLRIRCLGGPTICTVTFYPR